MFFAFGDDADEIAFDHHGANTRNSIKRGTVDRFQALADEFATVDSRIGRAHHTAMQHSAEANIVHISELSGDFCRNVDAVDGLADDAMQIDRFERGICGERQQDTAIAEQCFESDGRRVVVAPA